MKVSPHRPHLRGGALIEFALILPLLLFLIIGTYDYASAIQADNILVNLTREGANLTSRSSNTPQFIMNAVAETATPLDLKLGGAMIFTKVTGQLNPKTKAVDRIVVEQDKWAEGQFPATSRVWSCASWKADYSCSLPAAPLANLSVALNDGETAYVVEAFYDFADHSYAGRFGNLTLGKGVVLPGIGSQFYSMTVF